MARTAKASPPKARPSAATSGVAFLCLLAGFFIAYIGSRVLIDGHPLHWLSAFLGAVLGYLIGMLIYRWRGDIA